MNIPNPIDYAAWIDLARTDLRQDARFHPDDEIEGLSKSMVAKQLQAIIVCRVADPQSPGGWRYEVVAGVGRTLAARKLGWDKIRADVYEGLTEPQKLRMIFSENEDRKNASPLYQAHILKGMMEGDHLTQEELAESVGKTQANVNQYLSLLELSPKILENINAFIKLGLRHFMQLLRIENKDNQWKLAEMAREKGLASSELAALIDKQLGVKPGKKKEGRPKGDKTVGAEGFAFVQKGSHLRLKADYDMTEDTDAFLARLKAALLTWRESHPSKASSPVLSGVQTPSPETIG
jgi:ParB/RepB/Spo0J family partition protein